MTSNVVPSIFQRPAKPEAGNARLKGRGRVLQLRVIRRNVKSHSSVLFCSMGNATEKVTVTHVRHWVAKGVKRRSQTIPAESETRAYRFVCHATSRGMCWKQNEKIQENGKCFWPRKIGHPPLGFVTSRSARQRNRGRNFGVARFV